MNRTLKAILLSVGLCSLPNSSFSAIVYDNLSSPDLSQQYFPSPATLEFGDQITLSGTERTLSQFSFYYFLSGTSASTQNMTLRLYANTGVTNSPAATALYTSDPIPVNLSFNTQTISFTNVITPVILPDTFTWTVQFSNLGAGQTGGLLVYGPPIPPGSSFNDFWQKDGAGNWSTMVLNGGATPANFAARVTAVPEPGVLALGGMGALLLAGLRRFRKTCG